MCFVFVLPSRSFGIGALPKERIVYVSRMLDWTQCTSVERVPGRVSGAFVFKGTRLPVATLFENLEAGATVSDFLQWYEGVTREQVLDVLRHAERSLVAA